MGAQPVGASGTALGAHYKLKWRKQASARSHVLVSEKPIWQGELGNCGLILGTNALVGFGLKVMHSNGTEVLAQSKHNESLPSVPL